MGQSGAAGQGGGFSAFVPLILMFVIFYFLLIRPQQKKQKQHREMINNVKKGDRIVTGGGIHGRVTGVSDTTLTVEIAEKVRIKLNRGNISAVIQASAPAPSEKSNQAQSEKK
jgi:preprotein translocase subunit YajC